MLPATPHGPATLHELPFSEHCFSPIFLGLSFLLFSPHPSPQVSPPPWEDLGDAPSLLRTAQPPLSQPRDVVMP